MGIKKVLRIILIFAILYIVFGIAHTFFTGDYNFFEKFFTKSPSDAMFASLLWPFLFVMILGWGSLSGLIIALAIDLILIAFFIWLSYLIDKKLFLNKEVIQTPSQNFALKPNLANTQGS